MRISLIVFSALGLNFALPPKNPGKFTIDWKREDGDPVTITTTFKTFYCTDTQNSIIEQAHRDALELAKAAFSSDTELKATTDNPPKFIDFTSQVAIDYFGPTDFQPSQHTRIFDTLYRATETYRGRGVSDSYSIRKVFVYCSDFADDCSNKRTGAKYAAYISQTDPNTNTPRTFPWINYCPAYFDILPSHDKVADIKNYDTGQKKLTLKTCGAEQRPHSISGYTLTTTIPPWCAMEDVCVDTIQEIGPNKDKVVTYKLGPAKLLARRSPDTAAKTNDNFAYFATARFMLKNFGIYPQYPKAWDLGKSPGDNKEAEKGQPGKPYEPPRTATTDNSTILDDDDESYPDNNLGLVIPGDTPVLESKSYPAWYQPVLSATVTLKVTTTPTVTPPAPPVLPLAAQPDVDKVVCSSTTDGPLLPIYDDCVHALSPAFVIDDKWTSRPPVPSISTAQYTDISSETGGIAITYTGTWDDSCKATRGDVWSHALVVFEACSYHSQGLVGGYVPLNVPGCPANMGIVHTVKAISVG